MEENKFGFQIEWDPRVMFAERPRWPFNWREINVHPGTPKLYLWRNKFYPLLEEERIQITPQISEPPILIHNWSHTTDV